MTKKDKGNRTAGDEEDLWGGEEVPWRLEDEGRDGSRDGKGERGARFEPDDIPDEEAESRGTATRLRMGAVAAAIALLVAALVGAVVVDDDGVAGVEFEGSRSDTGDTQGANGTASEADANENGVLALPLEAGATGGDQRIRLRNVGDGIETSDLRIEVVLVDHGSSATVTDLPAERLELGKNVEGDDIFDRSYTGVGGAASEEAWHEDELFLRLKHGDGGAEMEPGDEVRVEVTRTGSGEVLYSGTLEAE